MTTAPSEALKLYGTEQEAPAARTLSAGALSASLDAGKLRWIRLAARKPCAASPSWCAARAGRHMRRRSRTWRSRRARADSAWATTRASSLPTACSPTAPTSWRTTSGASSSRSTSSRRPNSGPAARASSRCTRWRGWRASPAPSPTATARWRRRASPASSCRCSPSSTFPPCATGSRRGCGSPAGSRAPTRGRRRTSATGPMRPTRPTTARWRCPIPTRWRRASGCARSRR